MTRMTCTHLTTTVVCLLALLALLAQACSGGDSPATPDAGTEHEASSLPQRTYAPTITAIYEEILNLRCAQPFCHLGAAGSPPIFTDKETSYRALVNVPASGRLCADAGADLVVPGQPESSLLYRKVEHPVPSGLCGDPMPGGAAEPLGARDIQQIQQWIAQGALDN